MCLFTFSCLYFYTLIVSSLLKKGLEKINHSILLLLGQKQTKFISEKTLPKGDNISVYCSKNVSGSLLPTE